VTANPNRVGFVIAALIAGWHVLWAVLVLVGWAQSILDFVFWEHMINPVYVVRPFDLRAATTLVIVTGVVGYVFGFTGAVIWNRLHRR